MTRYVMHEGRLVEATMERPRPQVTAIPCPAIHSDLPPYRSPIGTGWIDGKTQRREDLARSGCRPVDPSEMPAKPKAPDWLPAYRAGRGIERSEVKE